MCDRCAKPAWCSICHGHCVFCIFCSNILHFVPYFEHICSHGFGIAAAKVMLELVVVLVMQPVPMLELVVVLVMQPVVMKLLFEVVRYQVVVVL